MRSEGGMILRTIEPGERWLERAGRGAFVSNQDLYQSPVPSLQLFERIRLFDPEAFYHLHPLVTACVVSLAEGNTMPPASAS